MTLKRVERTTRDRLKFFSVFGGIFAAISQMLVEAFRMGVFRSIIMSRNHLLVNARVNSKATNGTTRFEGVLLGHQTSFASSKYGPGVLMEWPDHPESK